MAAWIRRFTVADNSTDFVRWVVWYRHPDCEQWFQEVSDQRWATIAAESYRNINYEVRGPVEVRVPMPEVTR